MQLFTIVLSFYLSYIHSAQGQNFEYTHHIAPFINPCFELLSTSHGVISFFPPPIENLNPNIPSGRRTHKFVDPFHFSSDNGKWVLIRYEIYPNAEQVSIRDSETGVLISNFLWIDPRSRLFDLRSISAKSESQSVVGLADYFFSKGTDAVLVWNPERQQIIKTVEIPPPKPSDYRPITNDKTNLVNYKTSIHAEHSYYFRENTISDRNSGNKELLYSAQIIDWRTHRLINVKDTIPYVLEFTKDPFSATFKYVGLLLEDRKTIKIIPFAKLNQLMELESINNQTGILPIFKLHFHYLKSKISNLINKPRQLTNTSDREKNTIVDGSDSFNVLAPYTTTQDTKVKHLVHDDNVLTYKVFDNLPIIISKTNTGLYIWDITNGSLLGKVNDENIRSFVFFPTNKILAYTKKKSTNLYILSLNDNNFRKTEVSNFSSFNIGRRMFITNKEDIIIIDDEGNLFEIAGKSQNALPTSIHLSIKPLNSEDLITVINTISDRYLFKIYYTNDFLTVDIYSFSQNKLINTHRTQIHALHKNTKLSPDGKTIIFSIGKSEIHKDNLDDSTGIIHLEKLLP